MALEIFEQSDFGKGEDKSLSLKIPKKRAKKAEFPVGTFTITDIKQAVKNPNRANIFVNGKYRFSLDIFQLTDLGVKIGEIFDEKEIQNLEQQSEFGKLYALALIYCLMRPHSERDIRDYLMKKTLSKKLRNKKTGEFYEKSGVSKLSVEQVLARLKEKKYIIVIVVSMISTTLFSYLLFLLFNIGTNSVMGGISGVIFGLIGSLLALSVLYGDVYSYLFKQIVSSVVLMLFISVAVPSISLVGHLGGMIGGFIATFVLEKIDSKKERIIN